VHMIQKNIATGMKIITGTPSVAAASFTKDHILENKASFELAAAIAAVDIVIVHVVVFVLVVAFVVAAAANSSVDALVMTATVPEIDMLQSWELDVTMAVATEVLKGGLTAEFDVFAVASVELQMLCLSVVAMDSGKVLE